VQNACLTAYAIVAFIGVRNSLVDIGVARRTSSTGRSRRSRSRRRARFPGAQTPAFDWLSALHYGTDTPADVERTRARCGRERDDRRRAERGDGEQPGARWAVATLARSPVSPSTTRRPPLSRTLSGTS